MDDGDSSNHTNFISKLKGFIKNAPFHDDVTEEEIISMVREGHEQGTILASEAELIHNVFEFDDKEVKDIIDECYTKAKKIILQYEEVLHKCAELLLEKEKISREEFEALFEETAAVEL